jgi:hypothetical protein
MRIGSLISLFFLAAVVTTVRADSPEQGRPVPRTRDDLKKAMESLKTAKPFLPLPESTDELKTRLKERGAPTVDSAILRHTYLPPEWRVSYFGAGRDTALPLSRDLTRAVFWVVSRANNCHY